MALNLDPEFVRYIQGIYGNTNLDGRVIKQLYQTWKSNPQFIINAYNQKNQPKSASQSRPQLAPKAQLNPGQINKPETAQDDLSGITNFRDAFRIARQKGLNQFKWRGTKANPSGLFGTQLATAKVNNKPKGTIEVGELTMMNPTVQYNSDRTKALTTSPELNEDGNIYYSSTQWRFPPETNMFGERLSQEQLNNRKWQQVPKTKVRYQQGGAMQQQSSQEQELQKAFLEYLIQDAAQQGIQLKSEQDLQAYAQQLGEEGIKAKYQEFIQKMQGGTMAKLGAKLEYIKKLKGVCPEGYEMSYYKVGGRICKTCQKMHKMEAAQKGKKLNAVQQFKKDMKTKDEASRDSIAINKWQDQDVMTKKGNKGNFKNGTWVPDRKKYKK